MAITKEFPPKEHILKYIWIMICKYGKIFEIFDKMFNKVLIAL